MKANSLIVLSHQHNSINFSGVTSDLHWQDRNIRLRVCNGIPKWALCGAEEHCFLWPETLEQWFSTFFHLRTLKKFQMEVWPSLEILDG